MMVIDGLPVNPVQWTVQWAVKRRIPKQPLEAASDDVPLTDVLTLVSSESCGTTRSFLLS